MKAIVGLGNPGLQYKRTRHNAGFMVIDELVRRYASSEVSKSKFHGAIYETTIAGERVMLVKPMTFMNRSGQSIGEIVRFYQMEPAEDLLVIVDDVSLPIGDLRLRTSGSSGTHNGLADIERVLGTRDYPRLRIGIGDPGRIPRVDFVLSRFNEEEMSVMESAVSKAADACECQLRSGTTEAMNKFNTQRRRTPSSNDEVE